MNLKYAMIALAAIGMTASSFSAGADTNTVPVQDLKIVQEQGNAIDGEADEQALQEGDEVENAIPYYRHYRPYRPYRPYYRPYRPYYRAYYRPYYRPAYRPVYRAYYRPYYRYYLGAESADGQRDLQNMPEPQMEQPQTNQ